MYRAPRLACDPEPETKEIRYAMKALRSSRRLRFALGCGLLVAAAAVVTVNAHVFWRHSPTDETDSSAMTLLPGLMFAGMVGAFGVSCLVWECPRPPDQGH
jgi:hypothetical protein